MSAQSILSCNTSRCLGVPLCGVWAGKALGVAGMGLQPRGEMRAWLVLLLGENLVYVLWGRNRAGGRGGIRSSCRGRVGRHNIIGQVRKGCTR